MVRIYTVQSATEATLEMRGNFVKIVNKIKGASEVRFMNGRGRLLDLDYDVQAAVLELFSEERSLRNITVTLDQEAKTLRGVLKERDGVIAQLREDRKVQVGTGNITLGGFVAWAERVKGLFVEGGKS